MSTFFPGATLGILGGGQLGRMTAMAARSMGCAIHLLDPDPDCSARYVVDRLITAPFDDVQKVVGLAKEVDVLTLEIEKVSLVALRAAAEHTPVRPSEMLLAIVQDKGEQKKWLIREGFPVGPCREVHSLVELKDAAEAIGLPLFVKRCKGGYDGRGQVTIAKKEDLEAGWKELGEMPRVAEKGIDLHSEFSLLVARRPNGDRMVYPPALNHHTDRILDWSLFPGPIPPEIVKQASEIAFAMADKILLEGILVVEFFRSTADEIFVNELAPRPHNSFHATEIGCTTSQFEQLVRAVCDLPLGAANVLRPTAIVNLLGDLFLQKAPPLFASALELPGVRLHLYGKQNAKPGRKMGHLSACANGGEEAVALVLEAKKRLTKR